jgi:uncharacterized protein (TIGR02246 family)
MRIALRALVLVLLAPAVCAAQNVTARGLSPADIAAIKATSERWVTAVRARRWEDAAATFTTDAILRFTDAVYEGREAIQKFHETMPPWDPSRALHIDEIDGRDDFAFVTGHSTIIPAGGGAPVIVGRYIDIRRKQADGRWLFYRDVVTPVPPPAPARSGAQTPVAEELVGRWLLIAMIRNGVDTTRTGVTQGPVASVYDFKSDGTFTISLGEKIQETGTWSANANARPKIFDHVPNLPNGRRPRVPGIYEVGGGVLKICLLPESEASTHPARCESLTGNRSSIYILSRSR